MLHCSVSSGSALVFGNCFKDTLHVYGRFNLLLFCCLSPSLVSVTANIQGSDDLTPSNVPHNAISACHGRMQVKKYTFL